MVIFMVIAIMLPIVSFINGSCYCYFIIYVIKFRDKKGEL